MTFITCTSLALTKIQPAFSRMALEEAQITSWSPCLTVINKSFEWGDSELHTVPWNKSSHFSKRWKILMGDKTAWNRKAQLEPTVKFEQLKKKKIHLWSLAKWVCDYYQLATIISAHLIPITPCQSRRSTYICWYFVMNLHLVIMNLNNFAGY